MKKVYNAPEMTDLGEVMSMTKGTGGFGFQDLLKAVHDGTLFDQLFGDNPEQLLNNFS